MKPVWTTVLLLSSVAPFILCQSVTPELTGGERLALDQLRGIAEAIKKCPESQSVDDHGSGWRFSPPMNVVWDIEHRQSYRSQEIGYLEYVRSSFFIFGKPEVCKKNDRRCKILNEARAETDREIEALPNLPTQVRYEFDIGIHGLEFSRALWKHEKEDATHWQATSLTDKSCEDQAVIAILK